MLTTQYKRVLKRALRTTRRQQTRTLVTELLELRQLLYSEAILLSPPITLPSTTDRELAAIEGSRLINDSELGRAASTRINGAFDLSRETLEPKAELTSFRQRLPQPEALQYELIGAQFGPRLDWESIETGGGEVRQSSVTPVTAEQIVRITNEGVSQFFVGQSQARDHGLPTSQSIQEGSGLSGGYCLTDGELVFGSSIDSSMSSMGLAEGEGDEEAAPEFAIPEINIPRLELSSALGGPDNFMPVVQRTSTSTKTHGSFTSNSLDAPDLQADGTNWVHFVTRNWTSSEQWSFTERLVFVFNVEQNVQDSGDLDELNDGGTEDEDGSETGLAESGNWTSNVGVTRAGYFILTFSASRGISTPSHLGVVWSLNVSYRDGISVSASLNGASTFAPDPNVTTTSGDENAPDVPEDFVGHSSWGASGGVSVLSSGGFSVTSIPRLRITGPERIITASGHTEFGGSVDVASNWSASSISGNLIPPSGLNGCVTCSSGAPYSPLPNGGDLGIAYDAASNAIDASDDDLDVPFDPLGEFEGYGHAASSSGGNSARLSAKIGGSWDLSGVLRNGHYVNLVGGAFAAMESDTTGHGKSVSVRVRHS